jgi:hypothetical protein
VHLLLSPNDKLNSMNLIDFSNVGSTVSKDSNAFKKIQKHSKITTNNLTRDVVNDSQVFTRVNNLYNNQTLLNNNAYFYGTQRQHNHSALGSFLPSFSTLLDNKGLDKFYAYTLNISKEKLSSTTKNVINLHSLHNNNTEDKASINLNELLTNQSILSSALDKSNTKNLHLNSFFFKCFSNFFNIYTIDGVSDSKVSSNDIQKLSKNYSTKRQQKTFSNTKLSADDLLLNGKGNFYT